MLHEMIRRDRNKASVILWSVSNETPNNPARTKFLTNLANEARKLDPTRLITSALIGPHPNGMQMVQNDPLADALDVIGQNEYIGWYDRHAGRCRQHRVDAPAEAHPHHEFGAEAKHGNPRRQKSSAGPRSSRSTSIQHQFVMFNKIPQTTRHHSLDPHGLPFATRNIPKLQDGFNRKGLISEDGKKKQAFYLPEGL